MKKNLLNTLMMIVVIAIISSCGNSNKTNENKSTTDSTKKTVKTVENLKAAITGESTASAKYAAFATKAKEEGFIQISKMFEATSKAENIHAENHKKALEDLGEKFDVKLDAFEVKTTKENLEGSIKGESYEFETMYPGFITQAETDQAEKATKSFKWALDTEKKHKALYAKALDALNAKKDKTLPSEYFVCPKCGFTYDKKDVIENCEICDTEKAKFIAFK
jgi:rubrerythrin